MLLHILGGSLLDLMPGHVHGCVLYTCILQIDDATLMYYRNTGGEKEFKYLELEADIDENMSDLCLVFDK